MTTSAKLRGVLGLEILLAMPLSGCGRTNPVPDTEDEIAELEGEDDDDAVDGDSLAVEGETPEPTEETREMAGSGPAVCGDHIVSGAEQCEAGEDIAVTCATFGYAGGLLSCDACLFDMSECYTCGDGVVSDAEQCDGDNIADLGCADVGFDGGQLGCDWACMFDTSSCWVDTCGDGTIQDHEECEPGSAFAVSCEQLGWGGTVAPCGADCRYDLSACTAD